MGGGLGRDRPAAPLEQERVAPDAVELGDPVANADYAEAAAQMEREACAVLGEDRRLDRPDAVALRSRDELVEQRPRDAAALPVRCDVDAVLRHARVTRAAGRRRERGPPDDLLRLDGHEPVPRQVRRVPRVPGRDLDLERRESRLYPLPVDLRHGWPVPPAERAQHHAVPAEASLRPKSAIHRSWATR